MPIKQTHLRLDSVADQPLHSGASGSDEKISASKIQPLDSETKNNQEHDTSSRGVAGSDRNIDQARTNPLGGAGTAIHTDWFRLQ